MSEKNYTPTHWLVTCIGSKWALFNPTKGIETFVIARDISQDNAAHIVHCVNTFEQREALIKEMAEALENIERILDKKQREMGISLAEINIGGIAVKVLSKYKSNLG